MKLKSIVTAAWTAATLGATCLVATPAMADDVRCGSSPGANNYCRVDTSRGVELIYQHSGYACYQNDTWGHDRGGIWVSNGCSATFRIGNSEREDNTAAAVGLGILALGILGAVADDQNQHHRYSNPPPQSSYPPGGQPYQGQYPGNYDDEEEDEEDYVLISCSSKNNKYKQCPIRIRGHAELVRQKSRNACRFNKTWGYDRRGVWVSKGCRAEFAVYQ